MGMPNGNDFASKGVAGSALGLGIAGTALGLLNNGNCGNGLLNGLFGNNCNRGAEMQYVSQLQAENSMLKSQNYSDKVARETYAQTLVDNKTLRDEMYAFIKPLSDESAQNRVNIAVLQEQAKCSQEKAELREQIVLGKINEVAIASNGRFNAIDNSIATLTGRVDNITKEVVPLCKVCPQPMPRFNSFQTPTEEAPSCQG